MAEEPAVIANNGFVNSVSSRIRQKEGIRKRVFAVVGVVWMLLLLVVFPIPSLMDYFQSLLVIGSQLEGITQTLLQIDPSTIATQPGILIPVLVLLLGAYALLTLQLKA